MITPAMPAVQPSATIASVSNSEAPPIERDDGLPPLLHRSLGRYEFYAIELRSGFSVICRRWSQEGKWLTCSGLRGTVSPNRSCTAMSRPAGDRVQIRADEIVACAVVNLDDRG